jgi:predicted ester cyclase
MEAFMSLDATTQTMNGYMQALLNGGDFGQFFAEDVIWTTAETGDQVQGREAVRDFIVAFHTRLFDAHPELKRLTIADGAAYAEAVFVGTHTGKFAGIAPTGAALRLPYCMAYDVGEEGISALRAYLPVAAMVAQLQAAAAAPAAG